MFKKLKRALFPGKYIQRAILEETRRLHQTLEASLAAPKLVPEDMEGLKNLLKAQHIRLLKTSLYVPRGTLHTHFEKLLDPQPVPQDEISYGLQLAARQLDFQIENDDVTRPIVCTVALGEIYQKKVKKCLESHRAYALRHGYAFTQLTLSPPFMLRHAAWYKLPLLYILLKRGYQNIFFIDADALITNPTIPLEGFFNQLDAQKKGLMMTEDEAGINTGVMFLKNTPANLRLLDLIWNYDLELNSFTWEQNALRELIKDYSILQKIIYLVWEAKAFNSFPKERLPMYPDVKIQVNTWTQDDFICHFSGVRSPILERLIDEYRSLVTK